MKRVAALAVVAACATSRLAFASPCPDPMRESGAPLRIGPGPAGLGTPPEACPTNEVAAHAWAGAVIDEPDFYGWLNAGAALRFRAVLGEHVWASLQMPGVEYWYVANATVEAETTEMSAGAFGLHTPWQLSPSVQLAPYVRALLPTETVYRYAQRHGGDLGSAVVYRPHRTLEVVGGAAAALLFTVNGSTARATLSPALSAEAWFQPWSFFAAGAGVGARARIGSDSGFEAVDPRAGLRFYFGGGSRFELGALFPLWGDDRTDFVLALSLGWAFPGGR